MRCTPHPNGGGDTSRAFCWNKTDMPRDEIWNSKDDFGWSRIRPFKTKISDGWKTMCKRRGLKWFEDFSSPCCSTFSDKSQLGLPGWTVANATKIRWCSALNPNDPIYSRRLTRAFSQIPRSDLRSIRNETTLLLWLRVMVGESPQKRRDRARSNAIMWDVYLKMTYNKT